MAGGLTNLSKMPACNIMLLGAQRKTLSGFSSTSVLPHTGYIYHSDIVQSLPPVSPTPSEPYAVPQRAPPPPLLLGSPGSGPWRVGRTGCTNKDAGAHRPGWSSDPPQAPCV